MCTLQGKYRREADELLIRATGLIRPCFPFSRLKPILG